MLFDYFWNYKWVILFYAIIIAIIYFNRKRFAFQAKFIALYRTKVGIDLMHKFADWFGPIIRGFGYVSIFVGYAGMAFITYMLLKGFVELFVNPDAPATIAPVIPGVAVPGSPIFVPFWYGITALFVVVAIHEFSHGIVSAAHKVKVNHSGIVFFGPLIGAFVEPDEKQLKKKNWWVEESIFAAGPVSNAVLSIFVILVMIFVTSPIMGSMVESTGFSFVGVSEGYPAIEAGVQADVVYTMVNGEEVTDATYLDNLLQEIKPGDEITIANENLTHTIVTTEHPDVEGKAFLGITGLQTAQTLMDSSSEVAYKAFRIITEFLLWVFLLSLGIGLANLLPIGPVDGGRMLHLSMQKWLGKQKALLIFSKITVFFLAMILILLIVPIFRAVIA